MSETTEEIEDEQDMIRCLEAALIVNSIESDESKAKAVQTILDASKIVEADIATEEFVTKQMAKSNTYPREISDAEAEEKYELQQLEQTWGMVDDYKAPRKKREVEEAIFEEVIEDDPTDGDSYLKTVSIDNLEQALLNDMLNIADEIEERLEEYVISGRSTEGRIPFLLSLLKNAKSIISP